MKPTSVLDLLTPEQMEELHQIATRGDETPTVSQRLAQMMEGIAGERPHIQQAMKEAQAAAVDKFATLLATPLHKLAKDDGFDGMEYSE